MSRVQVTPGSAPKKIRYKVSQWVTPTSDNPSFNFLLAPVYLQQTLFPLMHGCDAQNVSCVEYGNGFAYGEHNNIVYRAVTFPLGFYHGALVKWKCNRENRQQRNTNNAEWLSTSNANALAEKMVRKMHTAELGIRTITTSNPLHSILFFFSVCFSH